jgi:hypothetical protein
MPFDIEAVLDLTIHVATGYLDVEGGGYLDVDGAPDPEFASEAVRLKIHSHACLFYRPCSQASRCSLQALMQSSELPMGTISNALFEASINEGVRPFRLFPTCCNKRLIYNRVVDRGVPRCQGGASVTNPLILWCDVMNVFVG